jgi:NTE family protein
MTKKVGLALGSGAAKGFAHIGVLQVLEENKIPIDLISGSSIGSVVAGFYASGHDSKKIKELAQKTKWIKLIDFGWPKHGLIKGEKIEKYLKEKLKNIKIEKLKIPLFITAVDLNNSTEVVLSKGDLAKAIRASISIPGIFNPVEINNQILIDGAWKNPVPADILKKAGADIIIAVNLNKKSKKSKEESALKIPSMFNVLLKSLRITNEEATHHKIDRKIINILIEPELEDIKLNDFDKIELAIQRGREAAEKHIEEIKKLTKRKGKIRGLISKLVKKFRN